MFWDENREFGHEMKVMTFTFFWLSLYFCVESSHNASWKLCKSNFVKLSFLKIKVPFYKFCPLPAKNFGSLDNNSASKSQTDSRLN